MDSSDIRVRANFASQLRHHLKRLRAGKVLVHLPKRSDLYTRRPNALFHAQPEFFIQTGGATDFVCPGSSFRLKTGQMCVIPRGLPHAETPIDLKSPYRVLVVGDSFMLEGCADEDRRILSQPWVYFEKQKRLLDLMRYLDDAAEHSMLPQSDQRGFVQSLLEAFMLGTLHELARKPDAMVPELPPLVMEAKKYVRIHLNESSLTVREIAGALGCTPDHLSRLFRQVEGMTLMSWISRERIELAKNLLEKTPRNVAEVGWASGFNEPSYFIRIFKRYAGTTPRNYRVQLQRG